MMHSSSKVEFTSVYFIDGVPWNFYLQKASDYQSLRLIESQVRQSLQELEEEDSPRVHEVYGVRWEEDGSYYRGEILRDLGEDLFLVRFIDYGCLETQKRSGIKHIAQSLASVPTFAINCCLKNLESFRGLTCRGSVYKLFVDWCGVGLPLQAQLFPSNGFFSVSLYLHVSPSLFSPSSTELPYLPSDKVIHWISQTDTLPSSPFEEQLKDVFFVSEEETSLVDNMSSVRPSVTNPEGSMSSSESFSRATESSSESKSSIPFKPTFPKCVEVKRGQKIKIYYTGGSGPHEFHAIFLDLESNQFPELNDKLQMFYSEKEDVEEPVLEKGSLVAVYEFDSWHRGEIRGDKILLVDSGELLDLEPFGLHALDPQFLSLPPLAKTCRVYHPRGDLPQSFPKEALEYFESLFEQITEATYMGTDGEDGVHLLSPLSKEGVPFQCLLKEKGFGFSDFVTLNSKQETDKGLSHWDPAKADFENPNNTLAYRSDAVDCLLNQNYSIAPGGVEKPSVCKFFRAKKPCPKGDKCQFLHSSLEDPNAFAGLDVAYKEMEVIRLPATDSLVIVQITSISSLTYFYILLPWGPEDIESSSFDVSSREMLSELNKELNLCCSRVKANSNPFFLSDIVAAFHPVDKTWYRARITDIDSGSEPISVFFVDYGEKMIVAREWIRALEPRFLHFPFQAIESGFPFEDLPSSYREGIQRDLWARHLLELTQDRILFARIIRKEIDMKLTLTLFFVNEKNELVNVLQELEKMINGNSFS